MKQIFKKGTSLFIKKNSSIEQIIRILNSDHFFLKFKNVLLSKLGRKFKWTKKLPYYPTQISIEPTVACNYKCFSCLHGREGGKELLAKRDRFMDVDKFKKLLDELYGKTWYITFCGCGENFCHPKLYEMVEYAIEKKFYVTMETNGSLIVPETLVQKNLSNIHFALDCITQENYEKYRVGGNVNRVIERITRYCDLMVEKIKRGEPGTSVQIRYLVNRYTEHDYERIDNLFKKYPFVTVYKDCFIIPNDDPTMLGDSIFSTSLKSYEEWHPRKYPEYNCYRFDPKTNLMSNVNTFKEHNSSCPSAYAGAMVLSNGDLYPCCNCFQTMPEELRLGNVFATGFDEAWNGTQATKFRTNYKKTNGKYGLCKTCPSGRVL